MTLELFQVDAFTGEAFAGNPAAVCLLREPGEERWMQRVAAEMNLSETAFVCPQGSGWSLRWFTPAIEVDLCGHGTLAAAHVLFEEGLVDGEDVRFETASGSLIARRSGETISLDFPSRAAEECCAPEGLAAALGAEPVRCGSRGGTLLAELADPEAVRGLTPDFAALVRIEHRAVCVTAPADGAEFDFVSRFFAPQEGIAEDPVTGSAHCMLGPYWGARLGKGELVGYQASARGGIVRVLLRGERVTLVGRAVTVLRGQLLV